MGLLAEYGSDSESDEGQTPQATSTSIQISKASSSSASNLAGPSRQPNTASSLSSGLGLPPPKNKVKKPVKIGFDHPLLGSTRLEQSNGETETGDKHGLNGASRPVKKLKTDTIRSSGAGKSSLLDILPAPKRSVPASKQQAPPRPKPEGAGVGAGLARPFGTSEFYNASDDTGDPSSSDGSLLLPRSVKGKDKANGKDDVAKKPKASGLDLFGLSAPTPTRTTGTSEASKASSAVGTPSAPVQITSAPDAPDFVPQPPSVNDPYPGYYQLPSGDWAAYDPEYYMAFFASSSATERKTAMAEQGAMGKGWDGVQGLTDQDIKTIDVKAGLQEELRLAEERKKLTAPSLYEGETTYKSIGRTTGNASKRHQLTSLLHDAHANRQALEERIAANKRTKRDAGKKYGF